MDTPAPEVILTPPTLIPKFEFPVYPVETTASEQLVKYPSTPSWNHISTWNLHNGDKTETGPVVLGGFSLQDDSDLMEEDSFTGVERSLKAWEAATVDIYNKNEGYVMDSILYALLPPKDSRFTVVPERFAPRPSFSRLVSLLMLLIRPNRNETERDSEKEVIQRNEQLQAVLVRIFIIECNVP